MRGRRNDPLRRRLIFGGLVLASLTLLSLYFREPATGSLHHAQDRALTITGPLQRGADRAVGPFRDFYTWFTGVWDARSDRAALQHRIDELEGQQVELEVLRRRNAELSALVGVEGRVYPTDYRDRAVPADVISRSGQLFSKTITIDKGRRDGVSDNDPVVTAEGLVGRVDRVGPTESVVTLLNDNGMAVSAVVVPSEERLAGDDRLRATVDPNRATAETPGIVKPIDTLGPRALEMDLVDKERPVENGEAVVTSGWRDGPLESVYPPDIPIGRVTSHSIPASEAFQRVQIEPAVDLDSVSHVIVLIGGRLDREGQTATGLPGPGPAPGSGP